MSENGPSESPLISCTGPALRRLLMSAPGKRWPNDIEIVRERLLTAGIDPGETDAGLKNRVEGLDRSGQILLGEGWIYHPDTPLDMVDVLHPHTPRRERD